ncbi:MAG: HNH endonuclease [Desulfobulbaceae bacterium]|nr:HNH endonuclease [Desulfobulbaceae bacterium]
MRSICIRPCWARKRERRLARDGYRCRTCGISGEEAKLHVHHSNYEWFGRERMRDLITLCDACHRAITAVIRSRRKNRATDREESMTEGGCE